MIYHSLFESHLHFGSIIYGAATTKSLEEISTIQRKALRVLTRSTYNAHTDPILKKHKILKVTDLIHLNQSIFVRQFKNAKLPQSFNSFFEGIPTHEHKCRDDDYNLKRPSRNGQLHFPSCLIVRDWNQNNILLNQRQISPHSKGALF